MSAGSGFSTNLTAQETAVLYLSWNKLNAKLKKGHLTDATILIAIQLVRKQVTHTDGNPKVTFIVFV